MGVTGNEFWKQRSRHGRKKLFASPKLMWEAATEYFKWCEENPLIAVEQAKVPARPYKDKDGNIHFASNLVELPKMRPFTMQGLCAYLRCNVAYFRTFKAQLKEDDQDFNTVNFSAIISDIEDTVFNQKFTGAAAGFFNANLISRDLGLAEKTDNTHILDKATDEQLEKLFNKIKQSSNDED